MTTTERPRRRVLIAADYVRVLELIARGLTYAAIGRKLGITESTAKRRAHLMFRDLGVADRAEAVSVGYQIGVLKIERET